MEYVERTENKSGREEWLKSRRSYVTGTDAAKILGIAPSSWGGAASVWRDKMGIAKETEQNGAMRAGLAFESGILRMYAEDTDAYVEHMDGYELRTSSEYPRLACSLDGWNHTLGIPVDAKNIRWKNEKWGEAWTDDFPNYYKAQLQVQMMVTGARQAHLAVMFSGQDFYIYTMDWNEDLAKAISDAAESFWKHVEDGIAPPADGTKATEEYIKEKLAVGNPGKEKTADEEFKKLVKEYAIASETCKEADLKKAELANRIKEYMGDATVVPDWCTWKNNKDSQKVLWEEIAAELLAGKDDEEKKAIIGKHTKVSPGARQLRITAKGL